MIGKAADLAQARGWEHDILSTLSLAVAIPSPRWRKSYNAYIHCSIDGGAWGFVIHKGFEVMSGREQEVSFAVHRKRRLRPIDFALARRRDGAERRASGSSSGTTRRGPYASLSC